MESDGVDECEGGDETKKMEVDTCDDDDVDETCTLRSAKRARLAGETVRFLVLQRTPTPEYMEYEKLERGDPEELELIEIDMDGVPLELHAWCILSWSDETKEFELSKYDAISPDSYPDEIAYFSSVTTLLFNSRLYFMGGHQYYNLLGGFFQPLVRSLELDLGKPEPEPKPGSWTAHADLDPPRIMPVMVGIGNYIYIFGRVIRNRDLLNWGQRLHVNEKSKWEYLDPPPKLMHQDLNCNPSAYAVYYNCRAFSYSTAEEEDGHHHDVPADQNLILFPIMDSFICIFNCDSNKWLPSMKLNLPEDQYFPEGVTDRLTVVDGVLIWDFFGSIHGYDLINQKFLDSLFTIPDERWVHSYYGFRGYRHPRVFFLHQRDSLFLFFQEDWDRSHIHCSKFQIRKRNQGQDFCLLEEKYQHFSTDSMNQFKLLDVHPLFRPCLRHTINLYAIRRMYFIRIS